MANDVTLTGVERTFADDEIIVSKTDTSGRIMYANEVFLRVAGMSEAETIGQPHSVIRHPEMPRAVFKLLWDTLATGKEIFAYVINRSKNGDHYWVLAHVTPSYDSNGKVVGYHSNRRTADRDVLSNVIQPLYKQLLDIENSHSNRKDGMNEAFNTLVKIPEDKGVGYDELIFSLQS